MALTPDKIRRPGYAPSASIGVGRRGLHTRQRILACAADVFLANGYYGTSLDTIAKAANSSRATVYQYFAGKEDIFGELSAAAGNAVLDHGEELGNLGPTREGVEVLHRWLTDWADIYDTHAAVFAEFPGIGTAAALSVIDVGPVAAEFHRRVTSRLRAARPRELALEDAVATLTRIPHMVHLYRHRAMFPLPARNVVSWSLTVVLQLMLFPDTAADLMVAPRCVEDGMTTPPATAEKATSRSNGTVTLSSPIPADVLSVCSALFAEHGYYAVSMEDIAAAADISRATLYRYFSTKDKILAELTGEAAAEVEEHAATLPRVADIDALTSWMVGYVRFHRRYRGVIRAWFDGTVAEQLSEAAVDHGIGAIHQAVGALLGSVDLLPGVDRDVASAVFLAVLGRMSEPTGAGGSDSEEHSAHLMVNLLRRSLLCSA